MYINKYLDSVELYPLPYLSSL